MLVIPKVNIVYVVEEAELAISYFARTIVWINRCRRLAKDYENLNRTAIAFIRLASIRLMLRRLTRYCYPS